jgi:hypothetical protein
LPFPRKQAVENLKNINKMLTWWWTVSISWIFIKIGGVKLVLDFWRDWGMKTSISEAFPIETVEPPAMIKHILKTKLYKGTPNSKLLIWG